MSDRQDGGPDKGPRVDGMTIIAYLLGGSAVWGGVGWLVDRALGYEALFLPIGLALGLVAAIYLIYIQHVRP